MHRPGDDGVGRQFGSSQRPFESKNAPLTAVETGSWKIETTPNTSSDRDNALNAVACPAANDCWAVGFFYNESNAVKTLIEHYDGTEWSIVNAPTPSSDLGSATQDLLTAVTCSSTTDCWAVGYFTDGYTVNTSTAHFDGSNWTAVSSPNPVTQHSELWSVSCAGPNDCWAVGTYWKNGVFSLTPSEVYQTLIMHNTGSGWAIVNSPNNTIPVTPPSNLTGETSNVFLGLSCTSANDCSAVGWFYNAQGNAQPLASHYDGTAWSTAVVQNAPYFSFLYGMTCSGPNDCWAVGIYLEASSPRHTLFAHYDGTAWSAIGSPDSPAGRDYKVQSVSCAGPTDCWAVGYQSDASIDSTLVEHYDGTEWSVVASPNTTDDEYNYLVGVSCISGTDCWGIGSYYNADGYHTLAEHYTVDSPLTAANVVSRKTHGSAGTFDIDLTDGTGIECRGGGANGDHTLVFTFANPLTNVGGASVTSGTGSATGNIDPNDAHNYIVNLTGVTNAQTITVGLTSVSDSTGNSSILVSAPMSVLVGDTNGDRSVNSADISQTKSQSGDSLTNTNFRTDLNTDGAINSADISLAKSKSGTGLP